MTTLLHNMLVSDKALLFILEQGGRQAKDIQGHLSLRGGYAFLSDIAFSRSVSVGSTR